MPGDIPQLHTYCVSCVLRLKARGNADYQTRRSTHAETAMRPPRCQPKLSERSELREHTCRRLLPAVNTFNLKLLPAMQGSLAASANCILDVSAIDIKCWSVLLCGEMLWLFNYYNEGESLTQVRDTIVSSPTRLMTARRRSQAIFKDG